MKSTRLLYIVTLAGCDMLGPRTSDIAIDAPPSSHHDAAVDASTYLLPAGSDVPRITTNAELTSQIKINDGLSDSALAAAGGVITRSTGKASGATVMYWNFGAAPLAENFVASAPLYVLCDDDGNGNLTPRTGHPYLIDSIPGDPRYSPIRRIINVPVTASYNGQLITSVEALAEAYDRGLVGEPKPGGTWRDMPVVPTGTLLEVSSTVAPAAATEVYGRGFVVELFPLGGALGIQPLRNGVIPIGQESRLLSGVATGMPPVMPTALDPQPVFQYGIPAAPPTTTFNWTPIVTELDVRLASGVDPTTVTNDASLFKRSTTGAITGYYTTTVDNYTVMTTVSNKPIQFVDGAP
ncbi:MAG TPA: hypothetical protein VMZ53_20610 [Kofleriaceae bacterium]|nr:hypothetical protein [Kofleriaceae bacterium]